MKRRTFLNFALVFSIGAGLSSLVTRLGLRDSSYPPSGTERHLLAFYDPAFSSLPELFPTITSYPNALDALQQRKLLGGGHLNIDQLTTLAKSDPIIDYGGWQYLESELLVYLAAYLLVKESMPATSAQLSSRAETSGRQILLLDNIDLHGQAIKAYSAAAENDDTAASTCSRLCEQEPDCEFFTLARDSHPVVEKRHVCWLVKESPTIKKSPNYIAGIKRYR